MTGIATLSRLYIFTPPAISRARRCSCIKSVRVREDINPNHVINRAARVEGAAIILAGDAMKGFVENQCLVAMILADVVVQNHNGRRIGCVSSSARIPSYPQVARHSRLAPEPSEPSPGAERGHRIIQAIPSRCCISSSDTPLVSGYTNKTTKNWSPILREKKTNGYPPEEAARSGKIPEISAFINQCEKLPKLWPLALTRLGNTSLMNTQMTAPWEKAKKAM